MVVVVVVFGCDFLYKKHQHFSHYRPSAFSRFPSAVSQPNLTHKSVCLCVFLFQPLLPGTPADANTDAQTNLLDHGCVYVFTVRLLVQHILRELYVCVWMKLEQGYSTVLV